MRAKPPESIGSAHHALRPIDVVAIIVGLVIGAGIFKAPAIVAGSLGSEPLILTAWLLGGIVSLIGALCYAELASAYPTRGGEYHYLSRAYGRRLGFLFGWSRLAVLQTGSIALLAFVFGDYASALWPLGENGAAIYAATAVVLLTGLNLVGLRQASGLQNAMTLITLGGLLTIIVLGLTLGGGAVPAAEPAGGLRPGEAIGLAMIFVLLTYGGWNEAAYVSSELRGARRNMVRVLVVGIGLITLAYLLVNLAYLRMLGVDAMAGSEVVTADAMRAVLGDNAARLVSALIAVAVFASINVTILTGARTNFALGRDFPALGFLARWRAQGNAPVGALLVQGAVALALVFIGAQQRSGFETMVHYVSPVFWLFFLLTGLALIVLRVREPQVARPFRVPLYPVLPILFVGSSTYMLYASLAYSGLGALLGVALLVLGVPMLWWAGRGRGLVSASVKQGGS
ncbi:amino acid permease [Ectothiorhodospiraceae bacterium 2226]|nr:amino acid permease [Ectothiorhodospiraceae bacterium 2226]